MVGTQRERHFGLREDPGEEVGSTGMNYGNVISNTRKLESEVFTSDIADCADTWTGASFD